MIEEIKENVKPTLEYLKICVEDDTSFETTNCKALLDYITNLQEENKDLKELCDKYELEHNTTFKLWTMKMEEMPTYEEKIEMQKENQRLKEHHNKVK